MMQLPAGATDFEAGTFRGAHPARGFLPAGLSAGPRAGAPWKKQNLIMREKLYAAQIVRNSGTEILFMNAYLAIWPVPTAGKHSRSIYSALSYAGRPVAQSAAPLWKHTDRCGAAGCTGSGRARAAALLATQHDRGNSLNFSIRLVPKGGCLDETHQISAHP